MRPVDLDDLVAVSRRLDRLGVEFVASSVTDLLSKPAFLEALPGHLPPDNASQARLPLLVERLREIASLTKPKCDSGA